MARQPLAGRAPATKSEDEPIVEDERETAPVLAIDKAAPTIAAGDVKIRIVHGTLGRMGRTYETGDVLTIPETELPPLLAVGTVERVKE